MKRLFLLLLLVSSVAVFAFVRVHNHASRFVVVGAGAEAVPNNYSGPCPGVITFKGKIQTDAKGTVKYTWLRSDGATGPVESVTFPAAGVQIVSTTWTLGSVNTLPTFSGWEQIKILSPNEMLSNQATFSLTCTSR